MSDKESTKTMARESYFLYNERSMGMMKLTGALVALLVIGFAIMFIAMGLFSVLGIGDSVLGIPILILVILGVFYGLERIGLD